MRVIVVMIWAALWMVPFSAQADDSRSVNFMIFMKNNAGFEYDPIMFGGFSQFVRAMQGSRLLLLSHSAKSLDGDVLNLQQDVLREHEPGSFTDVGINCQLSFHYEPVLQMIEYSLAGKCQIIGDFHGKPMTLKATIPLTELPDTAQGHDVWIEVYEDKRSGVAFYANVSKH